MRLRTLAFATLFVVSIATAAVPQDNDESPARSGSVETCDVKLFPNQKKSGNLLLGAFRDADEGSALWKARGEKAPKVDFEKEIVVYAVHQNSGGTCSIANPKIERGTATVIVDTGERVEEKSFFCHYPYSMRSIARKDLRTIEFKTKGREKDDAICKLDPEGRATGVE